MIIWYKGEQDLMIKTIFIIVICILATGILIYDIITQKKDTKLKEENKHLKEELRKYKEEELTNK